VKRAAILRDSSIAPGLGEFGAIQALAPSLGVELRPVDVRDASEIERARRSHPNNRVVADRSCALSCAADNE
jgi:hypothetical protein